MDPSTEKSVRVLNLAEIRAIELAKPWSNVLMHNTSAVTTHVVIDRYGQQKTLKPGEKQEVAMVDDDIEYFRKERQPGRIKTNEGGDTYVCAQHPLVIEDVPALPAANPEVAEEAGQVVPTLTLKPRK